MRRAVGQVHYLAKNSGKKRRGLRRLTKVSPEETKKIRKHLTY